MCEVVLLSLSLGCLCTYLWRLPLSSTFDLLDGKPVLADSTHLANIFIVDIAKIRGFVEQHFVEKWSPEESESLSQRPYHSVLLCFWNQSGGKMDEANVSSQSSVEVATIPTPEAAYLMDARVRITSKGPEEQSAWKIPVPKKIYRGECKVSDSYYIFALRRSG